MKPAVSLKVMAEDKDNDDVSKVTIFEVHPNKIQLDKEGINRKINWDHVAKLSTAYENGANFPALDVYVDNGLIIVIDGQHRMLAAQEAIKRGVPVRALKCNHFRGGDDERAALMVTSSGTMAIDPLFRAGKYRQLRHFGWDEQRIANRVGESVQHVRDYLTLIDSNVDVRQAVAAGEVSATNAVKAVKKHGSKAGAVIGNAVEQARLTTGRARATDKQLNNNTPRDLIAAIRKEMESGGTFRAEDLVPRYAAEIAYLRGTERVKKAA